MRSAGSWLVVWGVACHDELDADLLCFGGADTGVNAEGLLPVAACAEWIADCLAGTGDAVVGACLLDREASLGGQAERGIMMTMSLARLVCLEQDLTEAIQRVSLSSLVADVTEYGQGLLEMCGRLLIATQLPVNATEPAQRFAFTICVTDLTEYGQSLLEMCGRLLMAA